MFTRNTAKLAMLIWAFCLTSSAQARLQIGITLHPYYSYVANIVGDKADVLPLIDAGFNPHSYQLSPADIARLNKLDALVVNGIGHDEFVRKELKNLQLPNLRIIQANEGVPLIGHGAHVNPHTFVAIDAAIRQVYSIAKALGDMDPDNAATYQKNAVGYARELRNSKRKVQRSLMGLDLSQVRIASTHNAYGYLLQEFGLTVAVVVEPAHGVSPTASQLQQTIDEIRQANIDVLFTELNMGNDYVEVIERETGIRLFHFSHMTHGDYSKEMVQEHMQGNLDKLHQALTYAQKHSQERNKHD